MIKTITTLVAASAIALAGTAITQDKINEFSKTSIFKTSGLKIIKGEEQENIYLLKIEAKIANNQVRQFDAVIDKKTENLYIGDAFNKEGIKIKFPIDMKTVKEAVAFTYGTGAKQLYVITDPECPYCSTFAKDSKGKLSEYTVNVILMPLSFHNKARAMINHIISGKDSAEKYNLYSDIMLKNSKDYAKTKANDEVLTSYIRKVMGAVSELEVRGTPSFFVEDNKTILKQVGVEQLFTKKPKDGQQPFKK